MYLTIKACQELDSRVGQSESRYGGIGMSWLMLNHCISPQQGVGLIIPYSTFSGMSRSGFRNRLTRDQHDQFAQLRCYQS